MLFRSLSIKWMNHTRMGVDDLIMLLDDEWTFELAVFIPSPHSNLCTGAQSYGWPYNAGVIGVNLLTSNTAQEEDCMLQEVAADFAFDNHTAQIKWDGICRDMDKAGRMIPYDGYCGIGNTLGPQESLESRIGFGKAECSTNFHFHFQNLQDLQWCNNLPVAWGITSCSADQRWVMPSEWYRPSGPWVSLFTKKPSSSLCTAPCNVDQYCMSQATSEAQL